MTQFNITESGELVVLPSATSDKKDFDFLVGQWNVRNRKLKTRLNNCTEWIEFDARQEMKKILLDNANMDFFYTGPDDNPFEGMALRLFNPKTRLWSIYWTDSSSVTLDVPVTGSFENGVGKLYAKDVFEGKQIIMKFNWDARNPEAPVWSQAFSPDNGQSWEWNWYMYFSRVK